MKKVNTEEVIFWSEIAGTDKWIINS